MPAIWLVKTELEHINKTIIAFHTKLEAIKEMQRIAQNCLHACYNNALGQINDENGNVLFSIENVFLAEETKKKRVKILINSICFSFLNGEIGDLEDEIPNSDWYNVRVGNIRLALHKDEFVILH